MALIQIPILYGNVQGGKKLTQYNWDGRISKQVDLVTGASCWLFLCTEMHDTVGTGLPDGGAKYFLGKLRAKSTDWQLAGGAYRCQAYFLGSKLALISTKKVWYNAGNRAFTDFLFQEVTSGLQFHVVLTHIQADDGGGKGKDRTPEKKAQTRELAAYVKNLGLAVVVGDFNSSTERKGWPRNILENAGWRGLRQRGSVDNGTQSTGPGKASRKGYWLDEIWTRTQQSVSNAALVLTDGASDHRGWLSATIGFDAGALPGSPTGPYVPPVAYPPPASAFNDPPVYSGKPWTAIARDRSYYPLDQIHFISATLQEDYPAGPDGLTLTGTWDDLGPALSGGFGVLLYDDQDQLRFNGHLVDYAKTGDRRITLIYASDSVRLWWKLCRPIPAGAWTVAEQTAEVDAQTGPSETRLLSYINRNVGPGARDDRMTNGDSLLRVPASLGRGPAGTTTAQPSTDVGSLAGSLAEAAGLRLRVLWSIDSTGPHFDVQLVETLDLTAWAQFSPTPGSTYLIDPTWRVRGAVPTVNAAMSLAGEAGARVLTEQVDYDSIDLWDARIEQLVDQSGTTDQVEINAGITDAMEAGAAPAEVSLPIGRANGLGGAIPLGALVTGLIPDQPVPGDDDVDPSSSDGMPVFDRIRRLITTIVKQQGGATVKVEGSIGSPDGIQTVAERRLATALAAAKKGQRL